MNFYNFVAIYGAAVQTEKLLGSVPMSDFNELRGGYEKWSEKRRSAFALQEQIKAVVLGQFTRNFPKTVADAEKLPQFNFSFFFNLLKIYPAVLTECNRRSLRALLADIKRNEVKLHGVEKIPVYSDFVSE